MDAADFEIFMRETQLRMDKLTQSIDRTQLSIDRTLTRIEEHFRETHAEHEAQRQALFRIFDRLDRREPGDATA